MCAQSLLHYATNLEVGGEKTDWIMSVIPLVTALLRQMCKDHESPWLMLCTWGFDGVDERIAVCFTPADREDVQGVDMNYQLWHGLL